MRTGTLLLVVAAALSAAAQEGIPTEGKLTPTEAPREFQTLPPSNCRYYCAYEGIAYCCDDGTRPIPPDHDENAGTCVEIEEHICETEAIYYNVTDSTGAITTKQLFSGSPTATPPCASDGYCAEDEKCCPTPCARKHLCLAAAAQENAPIEKAPTAEDDLLEFPTIPPNTCRYYCSYDNTVYCCDDGTRPLPPDHYVHQGMCVAKEEHICKSDGIYYKSEKATIEKLFSGSPVTTPPCASDGYCADDEKCCPTPCAKKHHCLKYVPYPSSCRYYCFWDSESYCCDDGSLLEPKNHDDHEGLCPKIEDEDCDGDREVPIKSGDKGYKQKAAACASDGYCARDEKCCPSKCAQRHVCLKANRIVEEVDGSGGAQELDF